MVLGALLGGALSLGGSILKGNEKRDQAKTFNKNAAQLREEGLIDFSNINQHLFGTPGEIDGGLYGQALQQLLGAGGEINRGFGRASNQIRRGARDQIGQQRQSLRDIRAGYRRANNQVNQVGAGTRNRIARTKDQGVASATSRAARQGLLGTSADFERSARGDAMSNLANLGEVLAQMRSGLAERQGQATAGIRQSIGQTMGDRGRALATLQQGRGAALAGQQASVAQAIFDRANAYAQNQQSKANFRLGVPMQTHVPSSGSVLGSALLNGATTAAGIGAQNNGWFSPQRSISYNKGFAQY